MATNQSLSPPKIMIKNITLTIAGVSLAASAFAAGFKTTESSYLNPAAGSDFTFEPLVTVGDLVPLTEGNGSDQYAFVGIPDAMGATTDRVTGETILFVAHELRSNVESTPIEGETPYLGAFVSRYVLDGSDASIISGGPAHDELYLETVAVNVGTPKAGDATAFTRFCSGAFAGPAHGMDRPIFLTNEESGSGNYDAAGSQSVAVMDGKMYTLPALGRLARETTTVMPRRDRNTVVISSEDGGYPSYVYMYVGTKQRRAADPLTKNGLTGGEIFVLAGASGDAGKNASSFTAGSINTQWVKIEDGRDLTANQLEVAADAAGGFAFARVEDIEFDPANPTRTMYVGATGGSGANRLGRLYRINFNPRSPASAGSMDMVYNADEIVTPGGTYTNAYIGPWFTANGGSQPSLGYSGGDINNGVDFPVSIDNIAVSRDMILICEDRNSPADAVFAKYGRNGGVWSLDLNNGFAAKYQADFNFSYVESRDGISPLSAGRWEASGVIDASEFYGPGAFIINVQGHGADRSNAPKPSGGTFTAAEADDRFVEDGQVLLMRPVL